MTDWHGEAHKAERRFRGNALAGAIIALALLLASTVDCAGPLLQLIAIAAALATLASAAYLWFDAALFRLAGTYLLEDEGMGAIDDTLERMGLRARVLPVRPLAPRILGTGRILLIHRIALAVALLLFAIQLFEGAARC